MGLEIKATLAFNSTKDILVYTDITQQDNLAGSTKYSTGVTNLNRATDYDLLEMFLTNTDNVETKAEFLPGTPFVGKNLISTNFSYSDGFIVGVYKVKAYVWYSIDTDQPAGVCTLTSTTQVTGTFFGNNLNSVRNGFADTKIIKIQQGSKTAIRTVTNVNAGGTVATFSEPVTGFTLNTLNVTMFAGYEVTLYALSDDKFLKCFQPKIAKTSLSETSCCSSCKADDITNLSNMFLGVFSVYAQFENELYTDANNNIKALLNICNADGCKC